MEIDQMIYFGDSKYIINKKLYRTCGRKNQVIVSSLNAPNIEYSRAFYIVLDKLGNSYWVKEYIDLNFHRGETKDGYGIKYEYKETRRVSGDVKTEGGIISAVKFLNKNTNCILMEYLLDYCKINEYDLSHRDRKEVKTLLTAWIIVKGPRDYDMSENNIMIKKDSKTISVKLVDFEYSPDIGKLDWERFIENI